MCVDIFIYPTFRSFWTVWCGYLSDRNLFILHSVCWVSCACCALQSLLAPAAHMCDTVQILCVWGLKIAPVLTHLFSRCQTETSPPAFVAAACCGADLWLKAAMLAGCGLCIIDADGGRGLQAIGCSLKKNQKVEWTQTEPERNLAADGEDGGPGDQHGAERRPDFGDTTSLPVHF